MQENQGWEWSLAGTVTACCLAYPLGPFLSIAGSSTWHKKGSSCGNTGPWASRGLEFFEVQNWTPGKDASGCRQESRHLEKALRCHPASLAYSQVSLNRWPVEGLRPLSPSVACRAILQFPAGPHPLFRPMTSFLSFVGCAIILSVYIYAKYIFIIWKAYIIKYAFYLSTYLQYWKYVIMFNVYSVEKNIGHREFRWEKHHLTTTLGGFSLAGKIYFKLSPKVVWDFLFVGNADFWV